MSGAAAALAQGQFSASALEPHLGELDCLVSKNPEELSSSRLAVSSSGAPGRETSSQIVEGSKVELRSLLRPPQFDGQAGTTGVFDSDRDRWLCDWLMGR